MSAIQVLMNGGTTHDTGVMCAVVLIRHMGYCLAVTSLFPTWVGTLLGSQQGVLRFGGLLGSC